jgi:UDP-N-acetylglucosamine--N-acetylmuramyl-(pentapeptide) pyrophosphoryl-undecaprenol N-acetylglucosamine transferase
MKNKVYLAAGGTGGHINAALSMGEYFKDKYEIKYFSGTRYLDYKLFKNKNVVHLDSKPLRTKNPFVLILNMTKNLFIFTKLIVSFVVNRPKFVVGAGGYVCGPTLMSAWILGVPVFIIEQNAVMGLTNKILSKFAKKIFVNFKETKGLEGSLKVIDTGNPINNNIKFKKQKIEKETMKLLIFGGSLGAEQINEAVTILLKKLPEFKLKIKHQVGKNKKTNISNTTKNIEYEQLEYIDDMEQAYDWSNIILARAGASTVSELRVVKKPTILIPYPAATDNHQYHNAILLKKESTFSVDVLNQKLEKDDLAKEIWKSLESIYLNKLIESDCEDIKTKNPNEIILKEIENVWNK